ncbi:MAG: ATP-binding protein [Pseudomonadales bacterium]
MLVVVTGPECSGKTTLTQECADRLGLPCVPEVARSYLQPGRRYQPTDLLKIAHQQATLESACRQEATAGLVADTDLQTIYIWWQEKYGPAPTALVQAYAGQSERCYLLCTPDLPWQQDGLRENPLDRERLFALYKNDLDQRGKPYHIVAGEGPGRSIDAIDWLQEQLR